MRFLFRILALILFANNLAVIKRQIMIAKGSPFFVEIPYEAVILLAALEDRRFFKHSGYDVKGICRASWVYLFRSKLEGASTIEQQLVRVLTNRRELSIRRKFHEISLACAASALFEKYDLGRAYLFYGYFGWRMNGIKQAVKTLGLDLDTSSPHELATMVARLKYPQPQNATEAYFRRLNQRALYALKVRNNIKE